MSDMISTQDAIRIVDSIDTWQAGWRGNAIESLKALSSAQPEITLESAIDYLHSIGWMQEHDRTLSSAQPDNSCDGCKYENAEDGVLVPCGFCKRSHLDNYERRTDGQVISE